MTEQTASTAFAQISSRLRMQVVQRDWLSSNHIVFPGDGVGASAIVDTGYQRHAPLTVALLDRALGPGGPDILINTHLHSDHCGGNQALQQRWPGCRTLVPSASFDAVNDWDEQRLTYADTGQCCPRFHADAALRPGEQVTLGAARWHVHAAPGHDPEAIMLYEPERRVLIAGDALWESRLAIIFPELDGAPGFAATTATLDLIEALDPAWVVPGHGAPFRTVAEALATSRSRLASYAAEPRRHAQHAARALLMFHLLEIEACSVEQLQRWLSATPIFARMATLAGTQAPIADWGAALLQGLIDEGRLTQTAGRIALPGSADGT